MISNTEKNKAGKEHKGACMNFKSRGRVHSSSSKSKKDVKKEDSRLPIVRKFLECPWRPINLELSN